MLQKYHIFFCKLWYCIQTQPRNSNALETWRGFAAPSGELSREQYTFNTFVVNYIYVIDGFLVCANSTSYLDKVTYLIQNCCSYKLNLQRLSFVPIEEEGKYIRGRKQGGNEIPWPISYHIQPRCWLKIMTIALNCWRKEVASYCL